MKPYHILNANGKKLIGIDEPMQAHEPFFNPIVGDWRKHTPGEYLDYPFGDLVWARMIVPAGFEALIAVRPQAIREIV